MKISVPASPHPPSGSAVRNRRKPPGLRLPHRVTASIFKLD
ncbi:hypothetical protein [Dendronalium phyllosphericum]|nr:hypothetical protein [Dendronalium phyllosphericum]